MRMRKCKKYSVETILNDEGKIIKQIYSPIIEKVEEKEECTIEFIDSVDGMDEEDEENDTVEMVVLRNIGPKEIDAQGIVSEHITNKRNIRRQNSILYRILRKMKIIS